MPPAKTFVLTMTFRFSFRCMGQSLAQKLRQPGQRTRAQVKSVKRRMTNSAMMEKKMFRPMYWLAIGPCRSRKGKRN